MNGQKIANMLITIWEWVYKLFVINILFIIGSLLGLVILGIGPALVATLTCIKELLKGDLHYVISSYKKSYKQNFIPANIFMIVFMVLLVIVRGNFSFLGYYFQVGDSVFLLVSTFIGTIVSLYLAVSFLIYGFALIENYNFHVKDYFLLAISIMFSKPLITLFLVVVLFITSLMIVDFMILAMVFGLTPLCILIMSIAINYVFPIIDKKIETENLL